MASTAPLWFGEGVCIRASTEVDNVDILVLVASLHVMTKELSVNALRVISGAPYRLLAVMIDVSLLSSRAGYDRSVCPEGNVSFGVGEGSSA